MAGERSQHILKRMSEAQVMELEGKWPPVALIKSYPFNAFVTEEPLGMIKAANEDAASVQPRGYENLEFTDEQWKDRGSTDIYFHTLGEGIRIFWKGYLWISATAVEYHVYHKLAIAAANNAWSRTNSIHGTERSNGAFKPLRLNKCRAFSENRYASQRTRSGCYCT